MRLKSLSSALLGLLACSAAIAEEPTTWDILLKSNEAAYWSVSADSAEAKARFVEATKKLEKARQEEPTIEELVENLSGAGLVSRQDLEAKLSEIMQRLDATQGLQQMLSQMPLNEDGIATAPQPIVQIDESGNVTAAPRVPAFIAPEPFSDWRAVVVGRNTEQRAYVDLARDGELRRAFHGDTVDGWKVSIAEDGKVTLQRGKSKKVL